jgi:hypothetical protein
LRGQNNILESLAMSCLSRRRPLPTQAYLRERFSYDLKTGRFTWRRKHGDDRLTKSWNGRYAGKAAGSLCDRYTFIHLDGSNYQAANLALVYVTGAEPAGLVDHRDNDGSNNAFDNLREATESQNNCNRKTFAGSDLKGAFLMGGKWRSQITSQGKVTKLGAFPTAEAAHQAYVAAAREIHGEFAREL